MENGGVKHYTGFLKLRGDFGQFGPPSCCALGALCEVFVDDGHLIRTSQGYAPAGRPDLSVPCLLGAGEYEDADPRLSLAKELELAGIRSTTVAMYSDGADDFSKVIQYVRRQRELSNM